MFTFEIIFIVELCSPVFFFVLRQINFIRTNRVLGFKNL